MPQNRSRDEENSKRKQRVAKVKRGPGVFVYNGKLFDTEWVPTVKVNGAKEPVLDEEGMPVVDRSGRQMFKRAGEPAKNEDGIPVMGGTPKIHRHQLDVYVVRGTKFPKGEPVSVGDGLAFKLRCMDGFDEVEGDVVKDAEEPAGDSEPTRRKKRGRPPKREAAAEVADPAADGETSA